MEPGQRRSYSHMQEAGQCPKSLDQLTLSECALGGMNEAHCGGFTSLNLFSTRKVGLLEAAR